VNRSLLVSALALGAVVTLGAVYGKLTDAAPAVASVKPTPDATVEPSAPAARPASSARVAPTPTSPETERLDARRQLYESVDALVQASEFEKARKLLDEDDQRYGDDLAPEWHDLEQSYRLIADCLEKPSPKLRMRAQAFALVSQAAALKPRLLKACGETARR
jgi:hypothetical protein